MAVICSFCSKSAVHHHCTEQHTDCTWLKCHACGVLYDWKTDKAVDRDGKVLTLLAGEDDG